jgi:prepilin-type N-terminal cleavage/methylation domain-containing protein
VRKGFTLVETMVTIAIILILMALLFPALRVAVSTARNASVSAEINAIGQALAQFKSQYGDYPPSRIVLVENGDYSATNLGSGSLAYQLAPRSVAYLRKFWPRVRVSMSGPTMSGTVPGTFLDFNGNGINEGGTAFVLQGHECLVFFLGGLQQKVLNQDGTVSVGMVGFAKNPANPFVWSDPVTGTASRIPPFYEFRSNRLVVDNVDGAQPGFLFPGYCDLLGGSVSQSPQPFYAYFSAYAGQGYDPDDVNFTGEVNAANYPIVLGIGAFGDIGGVTHVLNRPDWISSPYPNPYLSSDPIPVASSGITYNAADTSPRVFVQPQSFQIISSGADRLYGLGGQFVPGSQLSVLPFNAGVNALVTLQTIDSDARLVEQDNLTNFAPGPLGSQ